MEIIDIKKRYFDSLIEYILPDNIPSNESQLYYYHHLQEKLLLKKYDMADNDKYIGNKLLTISLLHHYKDEIDMPELIIPRYLVSVDKNVIGCLTPFVQNNTNLSTLLQLKDISTSTKKHLLKEILKIVKGVQEVKIPNEFYLGDLHEANFIFNHDDSRIYAVDMDGCKIGNNEICCMKYGTFNDNLSKFNLKYPMDDNNTPIVSHDTEWYCFAMMVLNTIGQGNVYLLKLNDFYDYLQHLKDNGFGTEFVDYFDYLYTDRDNECPIHLLEQMPNDISQVNLKEFARQKNIRYIYFQK